MRILQVCNKFPYPPKDGGSIAKFSMIKGFYFTGHAVTVAAINTAKHYSDKSKMPFEIARMAEFYDVFKNTNPTILGALWNLFFSCKPYTATRFFSPKFEKTLIEILHSHSYDIVQLEGLYMCHYIPLIRKHSQAKIVYRAHNVEYEIWDRLWRGSQNIIAKAYYRLLTNRLKTYEYSCVNSYDLLVPITQRDADEYQKMGNTKPVFVAPTGVFTEDFLPKPYSGNPSLFHIGGLDWAPNQQGLVWFIEECLPKIRENNPDVSLIIAGRNAPSWFIQKMKAPGVRFVGEVDSSTDFMTQHACMVVPLLAGSGMRIKIIEGLALGKVIVSTSVGAEGITAEHMKEICIANTADEFVDSINTVLKNTELFQTIEKNAVTFVNKTYDNVRIIQELIEFYGKHISDY